MAIPQSVRRYTPAEYYALEQKAAYKSDYFAGEIFAMAGGTGRHSLISINLGSELRTALKGKPCAVYDPNMRLKVEATGLLTYPDASVYCGRPERAADDPTGQTYTNPTVLIEILSPSTESYDRGTKASHYRRIDSLQTLVFVSQESPRAETYTRQPNGSWVFREISGLDQTLSLPSIQVELPLSEVYDRVDFTAED